jgi:hypothetical protein
VHVPGRTGTLRMPRRLWCSDVRAGLMFCVATATAHVVVLRSRTPSIPNWSRSRFWPPGFSRGTSQVIEMSHKGLI